MPMAGLTALQALRDKGQIQPGQKVLINGAAGGVGTFAVQIAKSFGAEVTGVCSTRNVEMVRSIGANKVIDYTRENFTSSGQHYDVIFDLVANHSFSERRRVLTPKGIYIGAGIMGRSVSIIGLLTSGITESMLALFGEYRVSRRGAVCPRKTALTQGQDRSNGPASGTIISAKSLAASRTTNPSTAVQCRAGESCPRFARDAALHDWLRAASDRRGALSWDRHSEA